MKTCLFAFSFAVTLLSATAQSCLPGGITFTSQAEMDNFPVNNPGCKVIEGSVFISSTTIQNLNGLAQVEQIGGDLLISSNPELLNLDGLAQLNSVGGVCRVQNNPLITHLDGLSSLEVVNGDFFYVGNNELLTDIEGLASLDTVRGIFQVWSHPELITLKGLDSLKFVGSNLAIFNNAKLATLQGLEKLNRVGGDLRLENNPLLNNIAALHHPVAIQAALVITGNTALGDCAVRAVCDYLMAPATFVAISNNGNNCQSVPEVETACQALSAGSLQLQTLNLAPNPTAHGLNLSGLDPLKRYFIRIFNASGALMHEVRTFGAGQHHWELTDWPDGPYFMQIRDDGGKQAILPFVIAL